MVPPSTICQLCCSSDADCTLSRSISGHSSSAKQSSVVTKIASARTQFDSAPLAVASMNEPYLVELLTTSPITSFAEKSESMPLLMASIRGTVNPTNGQH